MADRLRGVLSLAALAVFTSACGTDSTTSVNAPSGPRCSVTATAEPAAVGAPGGSGAIVVTTNRECAWEARSEADWLSIGQAATGQGDGRVPFAAAGNALVSERRGVIVVNDRRVEITQGRGAVRLRLDRLERTVGAERRARRDRRVVPARLPVDGLSQEPWLEVVPGAPGQGPAIVAGVGGSEHRAPGPLGAADRRGHHLHGEQSGATPPTDPDADAHADARRRIRATRRRRPTPTPTPTRRRRQRRRRHPRRRRRRHPRRRRRRPQRRRRRRPQRRRQRRRPRLHVHGRSDVARSSRRTAARQGHRHGIRADVRLDGGRGDAVDRHHRRRWWHWLGHVAATASPPIPRPRPRTGTLTVAGTPVTITQAAATARRPAPSRSRRPRRTFAVRRRHPARSPSLRRRRPARGRRRSGNGWIAITGAAGGTGSGTLHYSVASQTATTARSGTLTVAGTTVTIDQAAAPEPPPPPCTFVVTPLEVTVPLLGGIARHPGRDRAPIARGRRPARRVGSRSAAARAAPATARCASTSR